MTNRVWNNEAMNVVLEIMEHFFTRLKDARNYAELDVTLATVREEGAPQSWFRNGHDASWTKLRPHLRLAAERRDDVDDAHVGSAFPFHRRQALVVGVDPLRHQVINQRP